MILLGTFAVNLKIMLLHSFYIHNGKVAETSAYRALSGIEIYEVVRVMEKVPLFVEDHIKRFFHSAWLCHQEIPLDEESVTIMLYRLIEVNQVEEGNIRFSWCFSRTGTFNAYFIPHFYPGESMVREGVKCGILHAERSDPNAKVVHAHIREKADQIITGKGLYEVLLVNQHDEFTEGSRSNLFFLKDGDYITASSDDVLPGITRQKVISLLHDSGKRVIERNLQTGELTSVVAVFLTGTSPKILPVRSIDEFIFNTDYPELRGLIKDYDLLIRQYLKNSGKVS
jgi:branched-chain amino acid aminotransferase